MGERASDQRETGVGDRSIVTGLLITYGLFWVGLAIAPVDRQDWFLENLLAVALVAVLVLTYRRLALSFLSYCLILAFLLLHAIGAHYTYAEVPFGFWLKDALALSRNPFDRLVHFAYGALLVYPLREVLTRLAGVRGMWASYLAVSGILAQSGCFEVIEAIVAMIVSPELGSLYLGTQGDEWYAQKDMAAAFAGALLAMTATICLSRDNRQFT